MHIWTSWCVLGCPRVSWSIKTDRVNLAPFRDLELTIFVGCFLIFWCTFVAFIANNMGSYQTTPNILFASMRVA